MALAKSSFSHVPNLQKPGGGEARFWCREVSMTKMGAILQIVPLGVMQRQWTVKTLKEIIPRTIRFSHAVFVVFFGGRSIFEAIFFSERCRLYTPEQGTWKWWFPNGISFSRGEFSSSMLNTWDVSVLSNCGWWWTKMCEIREVWVEMVVATSVQVFFFLQFVRFSMWCKLKYL